MRRGCDIGERKQMLWWRGREGERERERKRGEAQIGNGLDFWEMAPKAVRKSPEPPNFHSSRPVVKLSEGPFFASSFSSHRRPISLCTIYLSLICFLRFLRKHYKHDPGPAPLRVNMRNSRALKSTLAALKWRTHTHTQSLTHELKYFSGEHMAAVRGSGIHKQHRQVRIKSWWGEV